MTASIESSTMELPVPKHVRSVVGSAVFHAFVGSSILLAFYNLFHLEAVVASLCWLLFVGLMFFDSCRRKGIRQVAAGILGSFARREFVWATNEAGFGEIQFGYRVFGRRFFCRKIATDKIEEVNWSTGQATSVAGRDMNDWHVTVWYDHGDPAKSERRLKYRKPNQEPYSVGPDGRKEDIVAFGHALGDFLCEAGARLAKRSDQTGYFRDI